MSRRQQGFTLVELAIVLVIIGLILGMAFKGRELIDGARVRSMAGAVNKFQTAVNTYFERYQSFPGDGCGNPQSTVVANCNAARNGISNTNAAERSSVPTMLNALNITQDADWKSPFGLRWGVPANAAWMVPNVTNIAIITASNDVVNPPNPAVGTIDNRFACALDKQIDDGEAGAGNMRANNAAAYTIADVDCWTTGAGSVQGRGPVSIAIRMFP